MNLDRLAGAPVLVAGAGVSGLAAASALAELGARVTVSDAVPARLADVPSGTATAREDDPIPPGTALVVTGPGRRPDHPLVAAAAAAGIPIVGEPQLAWWFGARQADPPVWLAVTGTNGKTTTVGMLATILRAAGLDAVACGNIGYPLVDAVRAGHRVLAVELSSFQLHWSPSLRPAAGCVLNVAEDHLDWHGSMAAYAAAKARVLDAPVAVAGVDDPVAAELLAAAPAPKRVGVTLREPAPGQLGIAGDALVDRAFGDVEHHARRRPDRRRPVQLEARQLHREHRVPGGDGVHQRMTDVPAGDRVQPGRPQDRGEHAGGRGLAVGAGHRQPHGWHGPGRAQPPGQLRLPDDRHPGRRRGRGEWVVGPPPGPGHDQPGARRQLPGLDDSLGPGGQVAQPARRGVAHGHPRPELHQRAGRGEPGDPGPGHQHRQPGQGRDVDRRGGHRPADAVSHSL